MKRDGRLRSEIRSEIRTERGAVLVFAVFLFVGLLSIAGYSISTSLKWVEDRRLQNAADAASLAAAKLLSPSITDTEIVQEAQLIGYGNNEVAVSVADVRCGTWDPATKGISLCPADTGQREGSCDTCTVTPNAVEVSIADSVDTVFSGLVGIFSLPARGHAIAIAGAGVSGPCIRPFGFEISNFAAFETDQNNNIVLVGKNAPGNWGKLQIGDGNMSSSSDFEAAMQNGACDPNLSVGSEVPPATGNAGTVGGVLDGLGDAAADMYVAVVDHFYNGNSQSPILLGYAKVSYLSGSGNGANWVGTFRVEEYPVAEEDLPGGGVSSGTGARLVE